MAQTLNFRATVSAGLWISACRLPTPRQAIRAAFPARPSTTGRIWQGIRFSRPDRSLVVYEPPSAGVRFRFDTKPADAYVDNVFAPGSDLSTHIYIVTNGDGADYVNAAHIVN